MGEQIEGVGMYDNTVLGGTIGGTVVLGTGLAKTGFDPIMLGVVGFLVIAVGLFMIRLVPRRSR
jgi:hypothetical protein